MTSPTRKMLSSRQYVEGGGGKYGGKRGGIKDTQRRDRDVRTTTNRGNRSSK